MSELVKIPKIVMQTWKGTEETLPEAWKTSPASIRFFMPEWQYVLLSDIDNDNFIAQYFPQYLKTFRGFEYGIQRADFIRYAWLYVNGGLYLDCDYELEKSLEELFYVDREFYVVPSGNFGDFYTNAIMASKPGARVWLVCLELASQGYCWWHFGKHLKVMATTGPLMFTKAVKTQPPDSYHILNQKLLTPCSVCDPKPCGKAGGYMKTLEGSSWISTDTRIYIYLKCNWRKLVIFCIIILIVIWILMLMRTFRETKDSRLTRKGKKK
jgi:mannosyltransferase OCH1-like enzyme